MPFFDVDFDLLVWAYLPVRRRLTAWMAWLRALLSPLRGLHILFTSFRTDNLYYLAHNGQVCFLEAVLNDTFDNVSRGIFISDPVYHDPLFLYRRTELNPLWLGRRSEVGATPYPDPEWFYTDAEVYLLTVDTFIVNVPSAITLDTNTISRMKALIDKYRLVSKKNYSIVSY